MFALTIPMFTVVAVALGLSFASKDSLTYVTSRPTAFRYDFFSILAHLHLPPQLEIRLNLTLYPNRVDAR